MSKGARKGPKAKQPIVVVKQEDEFEIDCREFVAIQKDLNLDDETAEDAYKTYQKISNEFSLGDPITDWYACAIYSSCRKSLNENKNGSQSEGNFVSLTRILRSCNISVIRFCKKMKNWSDMVNFNEDMRVKLNQLESSFNVTTAIFRKYKTIFEDIFKCPSALIPSRFCGKNRKNMKKQALASLDIYHFCWTLFVFIKSRFSRIKNDLMNSYHLLLVSIDYCFGAVLTFDNALDIINTQFYETLAKKLGKDPKQYHMDSHSQSRICIIEQLCEKFCGKSVEVKEIKKHWVRPLIKKMIEEKKIKKKENGYGIIDTDVIDSNFRCLKQNYEQFVLGGGDFDECVFLNDNASRELGTEELQAIEINEAFQNISQKSNHDNPNNLIPMTPLTSKQYFPNLNHNQRVPMTPISTATKSVSRLQSILTGHEPRPSERLVNWFKQINNNNSPPSAENGEFLGRIHTLVTRMGEIFVEKYSAEDGEEQVVRSNEFCKYILADQFPKKRLESAMTFFYVIFEKMFFREVERRQQTNPQIQSVNQFLKIFEKNIFIQALFICSLEIVIFCHSLTFRNFPWVLEIFDEYEDLKLHPFHVYKIIEPIIREEPNLPRDLVKHLSMIEERVQDSLIWKRDSPIWNYLSARKRTAPTCQDVSLKMSTVRPGLATPVKQDIGLGTVLLTPKKLVPNSVLLPPNQTVMALQARAMEPPQIPKPHFGPFDLFFRKVYLLATERLMHLCDALDVRSDELRQLMWTCLENAISSQPGMLCERNLDQLIMCAVYSVSTINKSTTQTDIKFQDIISQYKRQPQAVNSVYRHVLLTDPEVFSIGEENQTSPKPEKRGTIIEFYNQVFLPNVGNKNILQFDLKKSSPPLSPIPNRLQAPLIQSPMRQFPNTQIFVSPMRKSDRIDSPFRVKSFQLDNGVGLTNSLGEINRIINSSRDADAANTMLMMTATGPSTAVKRATKRITLDEDSVESPPGKVFCLSRRIQSMVNERQIYSATSSTNASGTEDSNDSVSLNSSGNHVTSDSPIPPILTLSQEKES